MADPYKFSFDVAAFLEEQEAVDTSVAPKEGVMKKPEAPVEEAPMSNADRLKKRFADTLSGFYSGTQEIRDKYNTAQETNPLFGRDAAQNDWIKALELSPVTTTDMGPDMGTMAMQDAQEQSAIRSVSGITESLGRPAMPEGEADSGVILPSTDSVSDMYPTQGLMSRPVQDTVSEIDTTTAAAPVEDDNVATYSVVSGDTLSKIAKANNTTVAELTAANPDIKDINKIDVGQEIKLPTVTAEEAVTEEVAAVTETVTDDTFTDTFVTTMGKSEGKVDHVDHNNITTLGYGILPATARAAGFDPDDAKYQDRKVLAKAVYKKMYKDANDAYPDVFKDLTTSQKQGVLSLYINLGEITNGVSTALSKSTPDFDEAKGALAKVVLGSPRNDNGIRKKDAEGRTIYTASKGLSKRRAKEYNTLMGGDSTFKPVKTISVEGTKAEPVFVWKDSDGTEVHRYTPSISESDNTIYQGLDKSSSMKDVDL